MAMLGGRIAVELRFVPVENGELDMDALEVALDGAKRFCCATSNILGVESS